MLILSRFRFFLSRCVFFVPTPTNQCISTEAKRHQAVRSGNTTGHHIVARAQEHILTAGCRVDARVGMLESVFVTLTLSEGRQRASGTSRRHTNERRHSTAIPTEVPRESWEQMDQINMEEVFLRRVRGRFRHNLTVTLQERCRAKLVGDRVGEERVWKAFGLAPAMLHKPKGVGSIGRVELL